MTANTLEQRARELLAAEYERADLAYAARCVRLGECLFGPDIASIERASLRAIEAALRLSAGADWQPIETAPKDGTWILLRGHNAAGQPMIPVVAAFRPAGSTHLGWVDSGSFRVMDSMADEWMPRPDAAPRHEPDDALRGDKT